uniref:envelope membrane protein n=1 Tax=Hydrocytium acuminatum TaxID=1745963 RepID=UPI002A7F4FD4|nr:envelope membrane protein [Hydrocytium acuminatum]WOR09525.1 envelope membrane protein [Hydrocytium acuminatum]
MQLEKIEKIETIEKIGFIPRSILRMIDGFFYQCSTNTSEPLIQQFRFSKYLLLNAVKTLLILFFVPLGINYLTKNYIFKPFIDYYWQQQQKQIFLNFDLEEHAFVEIRNFEEKIYFESFTESKTSTKLAKGKEKNKEKDNSMDLQNISSKNLFTNQLMFIPKTEVSSKKSLGLTQIEEKFREKIKDVYQHYNNQSREAVSNLLSDLASLASLFFLFIGMKISVLNTIAFLFESFFSLQDSQKSLLMLLFTDLLVGFHSPRGWEVFFHFLFEHLGFPENHNIILLLVGTFPVLLDGLFKYWIFRHLNRHSPATVATYQSMVE